MVFCDVGGHRWGRKVDGHSSRSSSPAIFWTTVLLMSRGNRGGDRAPLLRYRCAAWSVSRSWWDVA